MPKSDKTDMNVELLYKKMRKGEDLHRSFELELLYQHPKYWPEMGDPTDE